jgi:hypothetical protein
VVLNARAPQIKTERGPAAARHPLRQGPHFVGAFDSAARPRVLTNRIEAAISAASKTSERKKTMSKKSETAAKIAPAFRMYCVTKNGEKPVWQEIGAAWKHKDGNGLNLQFNALPLPQGEIVLRVPKPKKAA